MAEAALQEEKRPGRPVGSKTKTSRLRRLLSQLEGMAKTQAPEVIQKSLNGEKVDKDQLATAKWIVNTVVTVHKVCIAEEEGKNPKDNDNEEFPQVEEEEKKDGGVVFTLVMPKKEANE